MNILKIIVAVIVHQVLGYFWYSPMLFDKAWLAQQGKSMADMQPVDPGSILVAVVSTVMMTIVLSVWINWIKVRSAFEGAKLGFWIWLGFIFPSIMTHYAFLGHSFGLVAIDASYNLTGILLVGAILGGWRNKAEDLKSLRI